MCTRVSVYMYTLVGLSVCRCVHVRYALLYGGKVAAAEALQHVKHVSILCTCVYTHTHTSHQRSRV